MTRMTGSVLLVGSVPGENAEEVMRACAQGVGAQLSSLPDGETGYRRVWINFLAAKTYHGNPALETVQRPRPVDGKESWIPKDYSDHWLFRRRPGRESVRFEHLGYAADAAASYRVFCALRDTGIVPSDLRFQVSLPLTESAVRPFLTTPDDFQAMAAAYEEAMEREIAAMLEAIPASELAIQWDVCMEVLAVEVGDQSEGLLPWKPSGDPFDRYLRALQAVSGFVPDEVLTGCHLCYGDLGHRHFVEPQDLGVVVRMANAAEREVARPIDFHHVPVPRGRDDAAYFEPLRDLAIGDAKLYLGLVHHTDGVAGTLRRLKTAQQFASGFGIATECGFGRRPVETIPTLLQIHREVAAALV